MERRKAKTKNDLVDVVAELGITKKQAVVAVDAVFDSIKQALKQGRRISVVGFGTFLVKDKRARRGRNPKTGAEIDIPAKRQPFFKAGNILKEEIKDARQAQQNEDDGENNTEG